MLPFSLVVRENKKGTDSMPAMTSHLLCKKASGGFALTHSGFGHTRKTGEETFLCGLQHS